MNIRKKYKVEMLPKVEKKLKEIDPRYAYKILERLELLENNPRHYGCEKLSGEDSYRTRVGMFRIIYKIYDEKVYISVIKISHRKDAYK